MIKKKELLSSPSMRKQYFVANNLLGAWGSMQMTVMSEGLLLNSKYIKMGREEGGFQALLTQLPLVIVCHELIIWRLTIYGSTMVCHVKPSRLSSQQIVIYNRHVLTWGACFLEVDMNYLQTRFCELKNS